MIHVGLTGNIAAGKSVVADAWASVGVPVVGADDLARAAVFPGSPALAAVRSRFGEEVIGVDGALDRAHLRDIVFRDPSARQDLERILHPVIRTLRDQWVEARRREGASLVVSEIPLLFELNMEDGFDVIVVVDAPPHLREERLVRDRGLSESEARRLMASQGDPRVKREKADYVLLNEGDLPELREAALALLARLRERT